MLIGYACINTALGKLGGFRNIQQVKAKSMDKPDFCTLQKEVFTDNLLRVLNILKLNVHNNILLYRLSSNLLPLATTQYTNLDILKDNDIKGLFNQIKLYVKENGIRITIHPGQYTLLSSPNEDVIENSIKDYEIQYKILTACGGTDMVTHVGGVYGDKGSAIQRFIENYDNLPDYLKAALRLENDDKSYSVGDVLEIHQNTGVPIIYDYHHDRCNPCASYYYSLMSKDVLATKIKETWKTINTTPKLHLSSGRTGILDSKHSDYIDINDFISVITNFSGFDIMLESKQKDESVFRLKGEIKNERYSKIYSKLQLTW